MQTNSCSHSFNTFSCVITCKAANYLGNRFLAAMQEINCHGFHDCAGVATIMGMPQEVKTKFFGEHVVIRELVNVVMFVIVNVKKISDNYLTINVNLIVSCDGIKRFSDFYQHLRFEQLEYLKYFIFWLYSHIFNLSLFFVHNLSVTNMSADVIHKALEMLYV